MNHRIILIFLAVLIAITVSQTTTTQMHQTMYQMHQTANQLNQTAKQLHQTTTTQMHQTAYTIKPCVLHNVITMIQTAIKDEKNPRLTANFNKLTENIGKSCSNNTTPLKCQQKKLSETKASYESLLKLFRTAEDKVIASYKQANETGVTDDAVTTLITMLEQQKTEQKIMDELDEHLFYCMRKFSNKKFSYAICNFRGIADTRIVMQKSLKYVENLLAEIAKC